MQDNFDELLDSVNVSEASHMLDCIDDIQMNEADRIKLRDNVLDKAKRYGIQADSVTDAKKNIKKRGCNTMGYNDNDNMESDDSIINFNDNNDAKGFGFNSFLKVACIVVAVGGIGTLITFGVLHNFSKNDGSSVAASQSPAPTVAATAIAAETTAPEATNDANTSNTPAPTDNSNPASDAPAVTASANPSSSIPGDLSKIKISSKIVNVKDSDVLIYMVITASSPSGQKLWSYTTEKTALTELETIQHFGESNNRIFINFCGYEAAKTTSKIIALDKATGAVVWKNSDFDGASVTHAFDNDGTLYITGYYSSELFAINSSGSTIWKTKIDDNYTFFNNLKLNDKTLSLNATSGDSEDEVVLKFNTTDGKAINK